MKKTRTDITKTIADAQLAELGIGPAPAEERRPSASHITDHIFKSDGTFAGNTCECGVDRGFHHFIPNTRTQTKRQPETTPAKRVALEAAHSSAVVERPAVVWVTVEGYEFLKPEATHVERYEDGRLCYVECQWTAHPDDKLESCHLLAGKVPRDGPGYVVLYRRPGISRFIHYYEGEQ